MILLRYEIFCDEIVRKIFYLIKFVFVFIIYEDVFLFKSIKLSVFIY